MAYKTFGELKSQVSRELDIEDESFVQGDELKEYFNSAIRIVEAEIIKLGLREKYLQTEAFISTVAGQQDYDLPSDIIDTKIRKIVYRNNTTIYTLNPVKAETGYEFEDVSNLYQSTEYYMYEVYKIGEDWQHRLVPKAQKSVPNALRVIYFKDLNRYEVDSTNCDVPEICYEFILSYVRYRVYAKETHVNAGPEKAYLDDALKRIQDTLQGQIADPTVDLIDQDLSIYGEIS